MLPIYVASNKHLRNSEPQYAILAFDVSEVCECFMRKTVVQCVRAKREYRNNLCSSDLVRCGSVLFRS